MNVTNKILLVEDDLLDAKIIEKLIEEANPEAQLSIVNCLVEAYDFCRANKVDVILLDLNLPEGYGTRTIKEVQSFAEKTPIIVITGMEESEIQEKAKQYNITDFIFKSTLDSQVIKSTLDKYAPINSGY